MSNSQELSSCLPFYSFLSLFHGYDIFYLLRLSFKDFSVLSVFFKLFSWILFLHLETFFKSLTWGYPFMIRSMTFSWTEASGLLVFYRVAVGGELFFSSDWCPQTSPQSPDALVFTLSTL